MYMYVNNVYTCTCTCTWMPHYDKAGNLAAFALSHDVRTSLFLTFSLEIHAYIHVHTCTYITGSIQYTASASVQFSNTFNNVCIHVHTCIVILYTFTTCMYTYSLCECAKFNSFRSLLNIIIRANTVQSNNIGLIDYYGKHKTFMFQSNMHV